eukprot:3818276-Amphidinium_carterae.1
MASHATMALQGDADHNVQRLHRVVQGGEAHVLEATGGDEADIWTCLLLLNLPFLSVWIPCLAFVAAQHTLP